MGNTVIGNHPSFFFYLTLEVQPPSRSQPFAGNIGTAGRVFPRLQSCSVDYPRPSHNAGRFCRQGRFLSKRRWTKPNARWISFAPCRSSASCCPIPLPLSSPTFFLRLVSVLGAWKSGSTSVQERGPFHRYSMSHFASLCCKLALRRDVYRLACSGAISAARRRFCTTEVLLAGQVLVSIVPYFAMLGLYSNDWAFPVRGRSRLGVPACLHLWYHREPLSTRSGRAKQCIVQLASVHSSENFENARVWTSIGPASRAGL